MKWIIRLTRVDCITVVGLILALISIVFTLTGALIYSLMALTTAMVCDAHDGYWARRLNLKSHFGPALDSLVDVITYLVAPTLFLYCWGLHSLIHLVSFGALIGCGILRLAVFTSSGFDEDTAGGLYYRGLPVFWVPFWVLLWITLSPWIPTTSIVWGIPLTALFLAVAMIWDHRQYKPRNIKAITALLFAIIFSLGIMSRSTRYSDAITKEYLCIKMSQFPVL